MSVYENNFCKIEMWQDDVSIKFESSDPNYSLLKEITNIANENNCLFVITDSGKPISSDFKNILDEFQNSKAYRFNSNPDEVLTECQELNKK